MYIDVSSVPEFALSAEAQQRVGSAEFQQRLQKARESHWVNYTEVSELKMSILPLLFSEFKARHLDKNTDRARAFLEFVEIGGESYFTKRHLMRCTVSYTLKIQAFGAGRYSLRSSARSMRRRLRSTSKTTQTVFTCTCTYSGLQTIKSKKRKR